MAPRAADDSLFGVDSPEFSLIERFFRRAGQRTDVVLGLGDDAALTAVPAGNLLVTATDMLVAGTHFVANAPANSVGHRALAVNLSDIAAMAAEPRWASLALSLPAIDEAWLEGFVTGWVELAERWGVELIGGDTVRGPLSATVTVQGVVAEGAAIARHGAAPGDLIFVTGRPGAAADARLRLESGTLNYDSPAARPFLYPEPRLSEGLALPGLATAMIDLSDGLAPDLSHLLKRSGQGAFLSLDDLEIDSLSSCSEKEDALNLALFGGEDYELIFTVPAERERDLRALDWAVPLTCIGEVREGGDVVWQYGGRTLPLAGREFRHFEGDQNAGR